MSDLIDRQAAIKDAESWVAVDEYEKRLQKNVVEWLKEFSSAEPFHNITMEEVLNYIDNMPEDVWQEFTACLECRGFELRSTRRKFCGGDFA